MPHARPGSRPCFAEARIVLLPGAAHFEVVDERYVDRVAGQHGISLRTGCFCNPGAGEVAFTISRETLLGGEFGAGMVLEDYIRQIGLPSGGAIRVSLGVVSNFADVHRFITFASEFIDLAVVPDDLPPRTLC
jgi:selenocysteine lyase/cysteine desulfurase